MDKSKYIEVSTAFGHSNFVKQPTDNTKTIENKVQRMLLKIKKKVDKNTCILLVQTREDFMEQREYIN